MPRKSIPSFLSLRWIYLVGGIIALLVIYLVEILEPSRNFLSLAEVRVFFALDKTLGLNRVWDWTIYSGESPIFFFGALAGIVIAMFQDAWNSRRKHFGALFGYVLFTMLITAISLEISDNISDSIKRPSPWHLYQQTEVERSDEVGFIDFDKHVGMPDEKLTAWACLIALLLPMLPRTAIVALILMIYFGLCQLALGTQWFLTQIASFAFGFALAGLALLSARGPLRWMERKAEQVFLTLFWKSIISGPLPRDEALLQVRDFPRKIWGKISLRKSQRKHRFWAALVQNDVLPILGSKDAPYRLDSRPQTPEGESIRPSPYVRFVQMPDGEITVVKALRRWGGILHRSSRIIRYARSAKNALKLERLGLPVPRTYWVEESIHRLGMQRRFLSIEEYVRGRHLDPENSAEVHRCIQLLAQLHAQSRNRWGAISDSRSRRRFQYGLQFLRPTVLKYLAKLRRTTGVDLSDADLNQIWPLFGTRAQGLLEDPDVRFRLVHGDVTARNFLLAGDGQPRMIDFVTVRYDLVGFEIIKAARGLSNGTPQACSAAWTAYFEAAGPGRWQEFKKQSALAFALYSLRELAQGRIRLAAPQTLSRDRVLQWIDSLFEMPATLWGENARETDWVALLGFLEISAGK